MCKVRLLVWALLTVSDRPSLSTAYNKKIPIKSIEQKGMAFDHNFGYSFPLFSFLLKKEGIRKGE